MEADTIVITRPLHWKANTNCPCFHKASMIIVVAEVQLHKQLLVVRSAICILQDLVEHGSPQFEALKLLVQ